MIENRGRSGSRAAPAPTGNPRSVALAAGRAHRAAVGDGGEPWPIRALCVPCGGVPRVVVALDQVATHPAYMSWREAGGETKRQFVAETRDGARVRISGPMWCSVDIYPENHLDPGDLGYSQTGTEIAYADLAVLRGPLGEVA